MTISGCRPAGEKGEPWTAVNLPLAGSTEKTDVLVGVVVADVHEPAVQVDGDRVRRRTGVERGAIDRRERTRVCVDCVRIQRSVRAPHRIEKAA